MRATAMATFLLFVLGSTPAFSTGPFCFRALVFAAPDGGPPPIELIVNTYRDLLLQLGAKLSPEIVAELGQAENPFLLVEGAGEDHLTLRRRLADFESMLRSANWLTPDAIAEVKRVATEMAGQKHVSEEKISVAVKRTEKVHLLPNDLVRDLQITPDGSRLMASRFSPGKIFDLASQKTTDFKLQEGTSNWRVSRDGKWLFFPTSGHRLGRVPFKNGAVKTNNAKTWGELVSENGDNGAKVLKQGDDKGTVYVFFYPDHFYAFSPTGKRQPLLWPNGQPFKPGGPEDWNMIPGTDDLIIWEKNAKGNSARRLEVGSDGTVKEVAKWSLKATKDIKSLVATKDNQLVVHDDEKQRILFFASPKSKPKEIYVDKDGDEAIFNEIVLSPSGRSVAAIVQNHKSGSRIHSLHRFSTETGEPLQVIRIAITDHTSDFVFSPDESFVFVSTNEGVYQVPVF